MDLNTLTSGMYALLGSMVVALFALAGHWITQRQENTRHARKLAYEAAMIEWKERATYAREKMNTPGATGGMVIPSAQSYILLHLTWIDLILAKGAANFTAADYADFLRTHEQRGADMFELRERFKRNFYDSRK